MSRKFVSVVQSIAAIAFHEYRMRCSMKALVPTIISLTATFAGLSMATEDHEHIQALKNFVPDHPHLHELVDKTHQGDLDAKHKFERAALSARFNTTKSKLPSDTDEEHLVLHFLDDYTSHVSGSHEHKFMELEPFIMMLGKHDDLREKLIELGNLLERAECDFTCLGNHLTEILNESMERMVAMHTEL